MPKDKKRSKRDASSDSDSGPEDRGPAKKAAKSSAADKAPSDGEPSWSLGNMKFIKVFKLDKFNRRIIA